MGRSEAKTRKELIDPKLKDAGWFNHHWQIDPEYAITAGRIHFDGRVAKRAKPAYIDYLLRISSSKAIAVVEAKKEELSHLEGQKQAKDYATRLGLWFAYATNGHEIEFFNLKKNTQRTVSKFHTPEELWELYLEYSGIEINPQRETALTHSYYDEAQIGQRRTPRYYQEKAVDKAIEAIVKGENRVLITMATGTGKTFTSIQLVYKLWKAKSVRKVLFIVDRNLLADQAYQDFDNAMDKDACYRISPKDNPIPQSRDLYFGIYQTLVGIDDEGNKEGRADRFMDFPSDFFDLIVIDEAHRGGAKEDGSWFRLLDYFSSAIQVGLTATPKRTESNNTYRYFGAPVISYSLKNGIEDGYLSPYIIKRVTSNIDALGYRPERQGIRDVAGKELQMKDYKTSDFERNLSIPQRTRSFAYHLLRHLFSTDPLGKTIVFCVDQRHALDMAKFCNEAFEKYKEKYNLTDYKGQYAVRITGSDKDPKGKYQDLEKFQDLDSNQPIVVTTSKLLTTGVDVKTVKNVVIFRNIGSMVEFKQIIGRGTRTRDHDNKEKEKLGFFILEYSNNSTQLFSDPEWDDTPLDEIDEGSINVDIDPSDGSSADDKPIAIASNEEEGEFVDPEGLFDAPDEDDANELIRYRMSEEFLSGQVEIAAETLSLTGADGQPLEADEFVIYQSKLLLEKFKDLTELNTFWRDTKLRKKFLEEEAYEAGVNIHALTNLFFEKHKQKSVDTYDIIAKFVFDEKYFTKDERIEKAKELTPSAFKGCDEKADQIIADMIEVYKEMDFSPFQTSQEFFQTPLMRKHGTVKEIQQFVGGGKELINIVNNIQQSLYDERICA